MWSTLPGKKIKKFTFPKLRPAMAGEYALEGGTSKKNKRQGGHIKGAVSDREQFQVPIDSRKTVRVFFQDIKGTFR